MSGAVAHDDQIIVFKHRQCSVEEMSDGVGMEAAEYGKYGPVMRIVSKAKFADSRPLREGCRCELES